MTKHPLDNGEKDILKVLKSEIDYAKNTPSLKATKSALDINISESEALLRSLGRGDELRSIK